MMSILRILLLAVFLLTASYSSLEAQTVCPECGRLRSSRVSSPQTGPQAGLVYSHGVLGQLAARKAIQSAQGLIRGQHVGGPLGDWVGDRWVQADAEGCGFAERSSKLAENVCCYSGHWRQSEWGPYSRRLGTAVARGADNAFYAVILVAR